ncbi:hypothetical protein VPH46_07905, partial [Sphingomonas sp. MJ1 (PH-R8)]
IVGCPFAPMIDGVPPEVSLNHVSPPPPPPPEDLGDLKLYRVPEPVTVQGRAQKQVALLGRTGVPFERRYRRPIPIGAALSPMPTAVVLVMRNRKEAGLGLALPSGSTAAYAERQGGETLLLGLGALDDRAEGETFRIGAGVSTQVLVEQRTEKPGEARIRVTNANPFPVALEIPIQVGTADVDLKIEGDAPVAADGLRTWSPTVAAGSEAELRYRY